MGPERPALSIQLHPIDLVLVVLALEAIALVLWHQLGGSGPGPRQVLPNLAAGALLVLALRACIGGAAGALILLCLAGALLAHLADLRSRWPR